MKAVDFSFDAQKVTPEWAEAQIKDGVKLFIANLWTGAQGIAGAAAALRTVREAGGITAGYIVVHDGEPAVDGVPVQAGPKSAAWHITRGMTNAGDEGAHLSFIAIDVEVDPTSAETVAAAAANLRERGIRPVVYTSVSMWRKLCKDVEDLADVPLWDASYGQDASLKMKPHYGGWKERTGHQYEGDATADGVAVDYSEFADEFVAPAVPDEKGGNAAPTPAMDPSTLQNAIDVTHGWGQQFTDLAGKDDLPDEVREALKQGGHELTDVAKALAGLQHSQ